MAAAWDSGSDTTFAGRWMADGRFAISRGKTVLDVVLITRE
jgi:hypothetical protein